MKVGRNGRSGYYLAEPILEEVEMRSPYDILGDTPANGSKVRFRGGILASVTRGCRA